MFFAELRSAVPVSSTCCTWLIDTKTIELCGDGFELKPKDGAK